MSYCRCWFVFFSLSFHATSYWPYAFQAAVYLINRLLTLIINNQSSYECLYKKLPIYEFLKTFGCACFPFLRPCNAKKLQYCSTQCVFLSFSNSHKAYLCLHVQIGRIYVSRPVIFNEFCFPFSSLVAPVSSTSQFSLHVLHPSLVTFILPIQQYSSSFPSPLNSSNSNSTLSMSILTTSPASSSTSSSNSHVPNHPMSLSQPCQMETPSTSVLIFETFSTLLFLVSSPTVHKHLDHSNVHSMVTGSKLGVHKPKLFTAAINSTASLILFELVTYKQVAFSPEWFKAMANEF